MRTYRRPNDFWTLAITGTSSFIADLNAALAATGKQSLEAVEKIFFDQAAAARAEVVTNAIVPLDKFIRIRDGRGDDIELDLTNGATITGTEYLRRVLNDVGFAGDKETGYVTLVHPEEGPVNLYRTARVANDKPVSYTHLTLPTKRIV